MMLLKTGNLGGARIAWILSKTSGFLKSLTMLVRLYYLLFSFFFKDPFEDQFEKLSNARKEQRAKNELNRLKNIARAVKKGQGRRRSLFLVL